MSQLDTGVVLVQLGVAEVFLGTENGAQNLTEYPYDLEP